MAGGIALTGLANMGLVSPLQAGTAKKKPNIVFIMADDMGWGDLGCYGNPAIKTPNLDKLARQGRRFTNFYVNSAVCSPTRAAILTGQYPGRLGIHFALYTTESNKKFHMPDYLDPKIPNLMRFFQEAGYATGHFGKWHLGGPWQEAPKPNEYGIDESKTHVSSDHTLMDTIYKGDKIKLEKGEHACARISEAVVNATMDFIDAHKDEPFIVNVWDMMPHAPLTPNQKQLDVYPEYKPMYEDYTNPEQIYKAAITDMDFHIGRLLDKLDEHGLSENTIVIFTSDNGPEDIEVFNARHSGVGSTGLFRGRKRSIYEGGIREPLIIRWPAAEIPAGTIDKKTIISGTDFLPSLCKMAGVELPGGLTLDGEDMSEALQGTPAKRKKPLMWEFRFATIGHPSDQSPRLAMRDGDWKLLLNPDSSRLELYNLRTDPGELDNVASENPKVVAAMKPELLKWYKTLPDWEYECGHYKHKSGFQKMLED